MLNTKFLQSKRKGMGGIVFILCVIASVFTLFFIVAMSRVSTVISVSDNMAHIISSNSAVYNYMNNSKSYTDSNASQTIAVNGTGGKTLYSPLSEFVTFGKQYKIFAEDATGAGAMTITVSWDKAKRTCIVDIGPFRSAFAQVVDPHPQQTIIELDK